jgi:hypothetical protein
MGRKGIRKGAQGLLGDVLRKTLPGGGEFSLPADIRRALVHNIVEDVAKNYSLRIEARIDLSPKHGGTSEARVEQVRKSKK